MKAQSTAKRGVVVADPVFLALVPVETLAYVMSCQYLVLVHTVNGPVESVSLTGGLLLKTLLHTPHTSTSCTQLLVKTFSEQFCHIPTDVYPRQLIYGCRGNFGTVMHR